MNSNKAINLLKGIQYQEDDPNTPDIRDAIKLGIEAIKRVQDMRISPCTTADELLPGETKD